MKVFVLAGQSNMVGAAGAEELPAEHREPPENVLLYTGGQWGPLKPRGNWGPEIAFGHELADAMPEERIGLIKYAVGGTGLPAWLPGWTAERAATTDNEAAGPLYRNLREAIEHALRHRRATAVGVLWMQGERDSRFRPAGRNYRRNLELLIESLREDLGNERLPFILGRVNPPADRDYDYRDEVRRAQERVADEDEYARLVGTDDLPKRDDGLHYNAAGLAGLGRRLAGAWLELAQSEKHRIGVTIQIDVGTSDRLRRARFRGEGES